MPRSVPGPSRLLPLISSLALVVIGLLEARPAEARALGPFSVYGAQRGPQRVFQPIGWLVINPRWPGANPFDVEGSVTFVHEATGTTLANRLFYAGNGTWQFRFTGTLPGRWTYETTSPDPQLDGLTGEVQLAPDPDARGFVSHDGNQWAWSASGKAFIPAIVMWRRPGEIAGDLSAIDDAIQTFFVGHGFNGLHIHVLNEWYSLGNWTRAATSSRDPDGSTFEALEQTIARAYAAGGLVHLWFTGDCAHDTCSKWGPDSPEERRLLRYLAARMGPLPGWTMGYGYDINEDHEAADAATWFQALDQAMQWPHMLGVRTEKDFEVNGLHRTNGTPYCPSCNYESWVDHKPSYALINDIVNRNPDEPCFLEDRYRMRNPPAVKDMSMAETRRTLWHSALAGGPAAIWGNTIDPPLPESSSLYPEPHQIRTWATFWADRFQAGLLPCNQLTNGICARDVERERFVFYTTDTGLVTMNLGAMPGPGRAVAVDTLAPYAEIDLGLLEPGNHAFAAPYPSDWAVSVVPTVPVDPLLILEDGFEDGELGSWAEVIPGGRSRRGDRLRPGFRTAGS